MIRTDVLVIGSEGAGARAAIEAYDAGLETTIVTKGRLGRSGATITGAADLDVDSRSLNRIWAGTPFEKMTNPEDSQEAYFKDIVVEGKYINDQRLVQNLVEDVPLRCQELKDWGLKIWDIRQMPGHSYPRNMYTSGHELVRILKSQLRKRQVRLVEDTMVTDLLTHDGRVIGCVGLDIDRGEPQVILAKVTILATGGGHNVYPFTTGPEELMGDGQAMAFRAGAELINLEMTQFIPTTLIAPPIAKGNLYPFLIGPQNALRVWLLNKYGERFMSRWDAQRMEHSTRDMLSIGIQYEINAGRGSPLGGVYFSLAHLPRNLIAYFAQWGAKPFLREDWTSHGLNFTPMMERVMDGEAIEIAPASHFFMGGVRIEPTGATTLPGLYAAGEVAGGLNGANRLSGVAFAQIVVQGKRAGEHAAREAKTAAAPPDPNPDQVRAAEARIMRPLRTKPEITAYELKRRLQDISSKKVGVLRTGKDLESAIAEIESIKANDLLRVGSRTHAKRFSPEWVECLGVENVLLALELIARSALHRKESRGGHYRYDYPRIDHKHWLKMTVQRSVDGRVQVGDEPAKILSLRPASDTEESHT